MNAKNMIPSPLTYFIVDDHPLFRQGLEATLSDKRFLYSCAGQAGTVADALSCLPKLNPDFLILDHGLPGPNGLELLRALSNRLPHTKCILVTQCEDPNILRQYRDLGVQAMVSKINAASELLNALQELQYGRPFFTPVILELLNQPNPGDVLTVRENEVVRLIAQGKTNKEVAAVLNCSDETIKTHKTNIMRKLKISSSVEIGVWAIRNGLI